MVSRVQTSRANFSLSPKARFSFFIQFFTGAVHHDFSLPDSVLRATVPPVVYVGGRISGGNGTQPGALLPDPSQRGGVVLRQQLDANPSPATLVSGHAG